MRLDFLNGFSYATFFITQISHLLTSGNYIIAFHLWHTTPCERVTCRIEAFLWIFFSGYNLDPDQTHPNTDGSGEKFCHTKKRRTVTQKTMYRKTLWSWKESIQQKNAPVEEQWIWNSQTEINVISGFKLVEQLNACLCVSARAHSCLDSQWKWPESRKISCEQ